jgi:probable HAF family extracellular repeat protein
LVLLAEKTHRLSYINDLGQIIGIAETLDNMYHAFIWEKGLMKD